MRVRSSLIAAIIGLATLSAPAQAETLELEPATEWKLREFDDRCRVSRVFGEGENATTLWLEQASVGQMFNITLIGRPFRNPYGPRITMTFAPGVGRSRGYVSSTSSKGRPVISSFGVPAISFAPRPAKPAEAQEVSKANGTEEDTEEETVDLRASRAGGRPEFEVFAERFGAIESLDVSGAIPRKVSLVTGSFRPVLTLLGPCKSKLESKRQAESSDSTKLSRGAVSTGQGQWAAKIQANYPAYLIREAKESSVGVAVQINPVGGVTFCEIVHHTGDPGFNNSACLAMMRHARFEPALDTNGNPTWGSYNTSITYRFRN